MPGDQGPGPGTDGLECQGGVGGPGLVALVAANGSTEDVSVVRALVWGMSGTPKGRKRFPNKV